MKRSREEKVLGEKKDKEVKDRVIDDFLKFLNKNGLDSREFMTNTKGLPRYVRVNPFRGEIKDAAEILPTKDFKKIEWLPGCDVYAIPGNVKIASTESYKNGDIYGIDAAYVDFHLHLHNSSVNKHVHAYTYTGRAPPF